VRARRERRPVRDPADPVRPARRGHHHRRLLSSCPHRRARLALYDAAAVDGDTTEDPKKEFGRRARIGAGDWQALARIPDVLDPRTGFVFFAFVSHKLIRWATPLLLPVALVASVALAADPGAWGYRFLAAAQLAFYALAWAGLRAPAGSRLGRAASAASYFVMMNAALAAGFWRFVRGTQQAAWQRTPRSTARAGDRG
jgi:hypothetical protein